MVIVTDRSHEEKMQGGAGVVCDDPKECNGKLVDECQRPCK